MELIYGVIFLNGIAVGILSQNGCKGKRLARVDLSDAGCDRIYRVEATE